MSRRQIDDPSELVANSASSTEYQEPYIIDDSSKQDSSAPSSVDSLTLPNQEPIPGRLGGSYRHTTPQKDEQTRALRLICDDILTELDELEECLADSDDSAGPAAEILSCLEQLYDSPFGTPGDESLKRVVVALKGQVVNVHWDNNLCGFLREAIGRTRVRWVIDEDTIDELHDLMDEFGLDALRGTIGDSGFLKRYKLVEITD